MKKLFKGPVALVLSVLLLTTSVFASDSGAGTLLRRHHIQAAPGIDYYASVYADGDKPQAGHTLEIAPNSGVYPVLMPCDTIWGGRTMDWMADYAEGLGYNVVAAVNTAFFSGAGVPIGISVENGRLKGAADESNAFAVLPDGSYYAAAFPAWKLTLTDSAGTGYDIPRMNKLLRGESLHLYTEDYSTVSTRVEEDVWAVRLRLLEGEPALQGTMTVQVTEVLDTVQAVPIGAGYMVLSALRTGVNGELFRQFRPGDVLTVTSQCEDETLCSATQVTGCGDILVADGVITDEAEWNSLIESENPRTLVGWKADGTLVMHVADGRSEGYSAGLTLRQSAEEMLRLGCRWAVNMDGGGSSVLGLRLPGSHEVTAVNSPSDGGQRADGAYLLLVTATKANGVARYWHLKENNVTVLPGQRLSLTAYATDSALYPAAGYTEEVKFALGNEVLEGAVLTAPMRPGSHWVSVWGGGASGGGTIHVVSRPSDLQVTYQNQPLPGKLTMERGERLELAVSGSHYGAPLYADSSAVRYSQSAALGRVDADGVFTACGTHGTTGTLTVQLGGYVYEIDLTVIASRSDIMENKIKTALDWYSNS